MKALLIQNPPVVTCKDDIQTGLVVLCALYLCIILDSCILERKQVEGPCVLRTHTFYSQRLLPKLS